MEKEIIQLVNESWALKRQALIEEVNKATRQVEDILTLEDYYRNGHKKETLKKSLGEYADHTLDTESLSSLLSQEDEKRFMKKDRLDRVKKIYEGLSELRSEYQISPPQCVLVPLENEMGTIVKQSEDHLNSMAQKFGLIRQAYLEARAKYKGSTHDAYFSHFSWQYLDDAELSLCPPFVVWGKESTQSNQDVYKMLGLVSNRKPLKVLFLQSELKQSPFQRIPNIELLPITLRSVYLLQTASVNSNLQANLAKGLSSPRAGAFFVYWKGSKDKSFKAKAESALKSRAFPHVVYDPDASKDFVMRLDLSGNPDKDRVWPKRSLEYVLEDGKQETVECDFTYADYVVEESDVKDQFSSLPIDASDEKSVLLSDYLKLSAKEQLRKTPYIYSLDKKKHLIKLVPSKTIIAQTAERMQLWQSLQELAGIDNPFVKEAEKRIRSEVTAERDKTISQMKAEMETQIKTREKEAVVSAMKNLALKLTGLEGTKLNIKADIIGTASALSSKPVAAAAKPAEASKEEVAAKPAGDTAWVETKLCTTCDECTTINKKIFVYNKDKKAIIKDPKGGPFKDIVKAAEKCSARIIHPGKPQDPKEKDLDKLIKRAEKFQ